MLFDMYKSSSAIYFSMFMSIIYSIIFMYLMSFFAEKVAWCVVIVIQLGLIGITVAAFMMNSTSIDAVEKTKKDPKQTTTSIKAYADDQASY